MSLIVTKENKEIRGIANSGSGANKECVLDRRILYQ
jgi:hypothetical protein